MTVEREALLKSENGLHVRVAAMLVQQAEEALRAEGITKIFGLVFKENEGGNAFWEKEGYTVRTNLNYRNKSLNENVPQGE